MRIAYVCTDPGVPVFGRKGCSIHVQEVIRSMRRTGATVELFASRLGGPPPPDLTDLPVYRLPKTRADNIAEREQRLLAVNPELMEALSKHGPYDIVYERYALFSYGAMEYALHSATPGLLEVNAPLIEEQKQHRGLMDLDGAERSSARSFAAASALIAVSDGVASYLNQQPEAIGRVNVVPNGVNPDRFDPARIMPGRVDSSGFTIGFVGTLKPWHGLDVLIEAFAIVRRHVPDARLLIVGDGPERSAIQKQLDDLRLSSGAVLTGACDPHEIPALVASMNVAVAPYPPMDSFYFSPLKVLEYMAAGRAVIASRIGQLSDLIMDGVTGLLCPPGDATTLAQTILRVHDDPQLGQRLGRAARADVCRHRTWDCVVEATLALTRLHADELAMTKKVS